MPHSYQLITLASLLSFLFHSPLQLYGLILCIPQVLLSNES